MHKKTFFQCIIGRLIVILYPYLPDKIALKLIFFNNVGYKLNLSNPRSYNEKLQWLKINDIHPEYGKLVDKIEAKKYVAKVIGAKYIIPTIAGYDSMRY